MMICRDDEPSCRGKFPLHHLQNVFTTWTKQGCLAILGEATGELCLKSAFNSLLIDGYIDTSEYMELQSRSFFFREPVSRKRPRNEVDQAPRKGTVEGRNPANQLIFFLHGFHFFF